jgi:hypothetical protein
MTDKTKSIILHAPEIRQLQETGEAVVFRAMNPQPHFVEATKFMKAHYRWKDFICEQRDRPGVFGPYVPGQVAWVKETFQITPVYEVDSGIYEAGYPYESIPREKPSNAWITYKQCGDEGPWRPAIHMPRWASRFNIEITAVSVEQVEGVWNWKYEIKKASES